MSQILITGGGGLVGLNTAGALAAEGTSVVITARHGHDRIENELGPDAARHVNLDPETLRAEPYPSSGYNADLLTRDTGWRPQYTFEEALEDYLKWLSEHPY